VKRLTYFGGLFGFSRIDQAVWSPDSRYLAFWYQVGDIFKPQAEMTYHLATYDFQTQVVTDYCLEVPVRTDIPIWNPDSKQLIGESYSSVKKKHTTYLINIEQGAVTELSLPQDGISDWLAGEP
jgi:Tol biopolymer transport system component